MNNFGLPIRDGRQEADPVVAPTDFQPSLRDGAFISLYPGNELPGYYRSVPPGQNTIVRFAAVFLILALMGLRPISAKIRPDRFATAPGRICPGGTA